jgi:site-specific recombinase XerD
MFETLFTQPHVLAAHNLAPCLESRKRFLVHCQEQGYPPMSVRKIAWVLLVFSKSMDLCRSGQITHEEIAFAVDHRIRLVRSEHTNESRSSRLLFIHTATAWLRFLGLLKERHPTREPFFCYVEHYVDFMRDQRGLSPATISNCRDEIGHFLATVCRPDKALDAVTIHDVDAYLAYQGNHGWARTSLHALASTLRNFFRYAEGQGWATNVASGIEAPVVYREEGLPLGPNWEDVRRLVASFAGDSTIDLRDRAMIMLLVVYGLRRGEVVRLRLEDIDWCGEILHVNRPKQRCTQQYPLVATVGNAILHYLKEARPRSAHRELFLSVEAPIRPLSPGRVSSIVRSRLATLGIDIPRRGAHCLRHANARHLLDAGFALKEIGDHLGHRSASSTRTYAKVDLTGLRRVAEIDLGSLL